MLKVALVIAAFSVLPAVAEELEQQIECKNTKTGQILRSPAKGKGEPYFYSNKMMLELIEKDKVEEQFVLTRNMIDTETGVAVGEGEVFPRGALFEFNINFASKAGMLEFRSVKRERTKYSFDQCTFKPWKESI